MERPKPPEGRAQKSNVVIEGALAASGFMTISSYHRDRSTLCGVPNGGRLDGGNYGEEGSHKRHDNDNSNSAPTVGNEKSTGDGGTGGYDNSNGSHGYGLEEYYHSIEDCGHGGYEIMHGILPSE